MRLDEIDRILGDKLKDFEFDASVVPSWEDFEVGVVNKKRKRYLLRTVTLVAAAAACLTAALIYIQPLTQSPQFNFENTATPNMLSQSHNGSHSKPDTLIKDKAVKSLYVAQNRVTLPIIETVDSIESQPTIITQHPTPPKEEQSKTVEKHKKETPKDYHYYKQFDQEISIKARPMIAMSAYTSISGTNSGASNGNISSSDAVVSLGISDYNKTQVYQMGQYRDMVNFDSKDFSHKFPVIVGLNLDIELAKNLSLTTGVTYSYLESNATTNNSNFTYKYKQSISYLGVPVGVSYKFLSTKVLDLYATAGVGVDFAVTKKGELEAYRNGGFISSQDTSIEPEIVQFSAHLGAGVNINITPNLGFYIEPMLGHYFKSDDSPITYRTESPLRFSLKTGFRLKL